MGVIESRQALALEIGLKVPAPGNFLTLPAQNVSLSKLF